MKIELNDVKNRASIKIDYEELHFVYSIIYAAIQFIDDVDFAAVTGAYKDDARKLKKFLLEYLDKMVQSDI